MLDRVGALFAGFCAVHCALVPLAMATMPSFTLALLSWRDPRHALALWLLRIGAWEAWIVAGTLGFAGVSIALGSRTHRDARPLVLLLAATTAFGCALYSPPSSTPATHAALSMLGGFLLIAAHVSNLRSAREARRRERANEGAPLFSGEHPYDARDPLHPRRS